MHAIIEMKNVTRCFSGRKSPVVRNLNMKVEEGDIVGFLGPNGAGKTTTIKMLLGFLSPNNGTISVLSYPPYTRSARCQIGYLPETSEYYWFLTPYKLLKFYGICFDYRGKKLEKKIYSILDMVKMRPYAHEMMKNFSKGMKQRIGIAQALLNNPKLLILDEPASGLDPIGRKEIRELIEQCAEQKRTVFFSSHELGEVETVCRRLAIISKGVLLYEGDMQSLKLKNQQVMKVIVSGDFPAIMKKIKESALIHDVSVFQKPDGRIDIELFQRKRFYDLIDLLKSANVRVHFAGDKEGKIEDIFFKLIQEHGEQ